MPSGSQDVVLQVLRERDAADLLHQRTAGIGGERVLVGGARLEPQRHACQLLHEAVHAGGHAEAADLVLLVDAVDGMHVHPHQQPAVGETAGVAEEVAEADRSMSRLGDDVVTLAAQPDAVALPRRIEARHGVVELEAALFEQLHQGDARERLGHRVDAEDGVVADGHPAFAVAQAERRVVRHLAVTADGHLRAGDLAGLDVVAVEVGGDALETSCVEAGPGDVDVHVDHLARQAVAAASSSNGSTMVVVTLR